MDFTQQSSLPDRWVLPDYARVDFGPNGAEFSFNQRYDAPLIWTDFYILFGRVEVVMQAAPGAGIISSVVMLSDTQDEIDWEWSGNNFGDEQSNGVVQANYFGKGITGNYDRGSSHPVDSPQSQFHTYSFDWTPDSLTWSIDGRVVRVFDAADADNADHQYPQAPSKVNLGLWNGGDPGNAPGTIEWAGGSPDISQAPFTMYVKSVRVTNTNPCAQYEYRDFSGNVESIQCVNRDSSEPVDSSGSGGGGGGGTDGDASMPTTAASTDDDAAATSTSMSGDGQTKIVYVRATDC